MIHCVFELRPEKPACILPQFGVVPFCTFIVHLRELLSHTGPVKTGQAKFCVFIISHGVLGFWP